MRSFAEPLIRQTANPDLNSSGQNGERQAQTCGLASPREFLSWYLTAQEANHHVPFDSSWLLYHFLLLLRMSPGSREMGQTMVSSGLGVFKELLYSFYPLQILAGIPTDVTG